MQWGGLTGLPGVHHRQLGRQTRHRRVQTILHAVHVRLQRPQRQPRARLEVGDLELGLRQSRTCGVKRHVMITCSFALRIAEQLLKGLKKDS